MAQQGVRFVRVGNRIIPIRDKDPSRTQILKNLQSGKAAKVEKKYDDKYRGIVNKNSTTAAVGGGFALGLLGNRMRFGGPAQFALAVGGAAVSSMLTKAHNMKENATKIRALHHKKARHFIREFGVTHEGWRPAPSSMDRFKKKKGS